MGSAPNYRGELRVLGSIRLFLGVAVWFGGESAAQPYAVTATALFFAGLGSWAWVHGLARPGYAWSPTLGAVLAMVPSLVESMAPDRPDWNSYVLSTFALVLLGTTVYEWFAEKGGGD